MIVNFVVITKGSGRIAEVAARFTLDAMPGKQMAIDADLSAGLIDEDEARASAARELEAESAFFGAMDGAAKFVRGDAIAGLLITFINMIGGLLIGVAQQGMPLRRGRAHLHAADHRRRPGRADPGAWSSRPPPACWSPRPASPGAPTRPLFGQLGAYPRALGMTGGLLAVLAHPARACRCCPSCCWRRRAAASPGTEPAADRRASAKAEAAGPAAGGRPGGADHRRALAMDPLRLELGYGLLPLIGDGRGPRLTDQIKALRRQLAAELGFVMPSVRIQDNIQLPANTYMVRLKEIEAGRGEIRPGMLLVMDPQGRPITLPGEAHHRADLRPARHLGRRRPARRGHAPRLTVVDPATVHHHAPDRDGARQHAPTC